MQPAERLRFSDFPPVFKWLTGAVAAAVVLLAAVGVLVWQSLEGVEAHVRAHPQQEAAADVAPTAAPLAVRFLQAGFGLPHFGSSGAVEVQASEAGVQAEGSAPVATLRRYRIYVGPLVLGVIALLVGAWVGILRQFAYYFTERRHAIQAISESETRNIALLHALPDTIFLIDRNGVFLDFHARTETAGFSGSQFIGRSVDDAMPADIASQMRKAVEAALASGDQQSFEYLVPDRATPDGPGQHFEARIVSCWGDHALAIIRNITEREHAERAIREAESKFRILVEESLTGIYIVQDNRFVYTNPRFADILGYTPDELAALPDVLDVVFPEDRPPLREYFEEHELKEGEGAHYALRCVRRDGTVLFTEMFASKIEYRGRPAFIGTLLDVTEQREAEEKLRILGMAVEQSAEGVLVIDTNGIVCFVNPAWARMHGYTVEEVTGHHFRIFHTADQMRREVFPVIHRFDSMEVYQVYRAEMGHKRKDGSTFPSSTAFATLRDPNGSVIGAVGICRDITEQKQYEAELLEAKERAEEMSRMKSAFLTNMSHEIRTPLAGILGFATVLEEEVPAPQREFAQLIRTSGERLMSTLNAVLDLARLEAGEMLLVPRPLDLREEVEAAAGLFRMMASEKRLAFHATYSEPALRAHADPNALTMILNNLLGNAVKFTDAGEVRVDVMADAETVCLRVADTGVGIDPVFLPHIFEEFKQESEGLARSHEGSGLGLSITRRLVALMGGTIEVASTKGHGTTFTVTFPRFAHNEALALSNVA